jgi:hypothetical protein
LNEVFDNNCKGTCALSIFGGKRKIASFLALFSPYMVLGSTDLLIQSEEKAIIES